MRGVGNGNNEKDKLEKFKKDHLILPNANLQRQKVSIDGTVKANGRMYSLNDLQPLDVYSRNAVIMIDGEPRPLEDGSHRIRLFKSKGDQGETMLVAKEGYFNADNGGEIKSIDIISQDGSEVLMEALEDGTLVTIRPEDMDQNKLRSLDFGEGNADIITNQLMDRNKRFLQERCNSFKVVEVAVAYDSTFCAQAASNSESTARTLVEQAIARADTLFEPICVRVRLSYLEGFCSQAQDPYTSAANAENIGCDGNRGALQIFRDYWESSRTNVNRDVAHFFVGRDFPGSTIGCAATPALCDDVSYGIDQLSFTTNTQLQGNLFAHELGHNMGAYHVSDPDNASEFLMESSLNSGSDGVSSQSSNSILEYLDTRSCVSTEDVGNGDDTSPDPTSGPTSAPSRSPTTPNPTTPNPTTPNPTAPNPTATITPAPVSNPPTSPPVDPPPGDDDTNNSFRLENFKHRGYCVTVQEEEGPEAAFQNRQQNTTPIHLEPCDDASLAQSWIWNEETHVMQSLLGDNNKCLFAMNHAANRAPLVLWDCDSDLLFYAQWSYDSDDQTLRLDFDTTRCLDVQNGNQDRTTTLQMWKCNNGAKDMKWLVRG
ncbi:unnamed protein product [Cylindrotheca closterium]|uniref:Peptidase M12B domain-containing protein n=1 Tax=Cylindrotheca closterium TaxID=2856 RepID=A0AAD2FTL7_9STRA|nr:unnamed protein product [Cylindrotheca closterium]